MQTENFNCKKCGLTISSTCSKCNKIVDVEEMSQRMRYNTVGLIIAENCNLLLGKTEDDYVNRDEPMTTCKKVNSNNGKEKYKLPDVYYPAKVSLGENFT